MKYSVSPAFITSLIAGPATLVCLFVLFVFNLFGSDAGLAAVAVPFEIMGFVAAFLATGWICRGIYRKKRLALLISAIVSPLWIFLIAVLLLNAIGIERNALSLIPFALTQVFSIFLVVVHVREFKVVSKTKI